jgi:TolA-binding protein
VSPRPAVGAARIAALTTAAALALPLPAGDAGPDLAAIGRELGALQTEAAALGQRTRVLLEQYGREVDLSVGEFERRFSEAEIHFLLENYAAAIVFLYDIVDSPRFQDFDRYDEALYYLAESLYQQESYLPARGFFLELVRRRTSPRQDDAVVRLIEISGRTGDHAGIDEHLHRYLASGRPVRPEIHYVWGKLLFSRRDLEDEARWRGAREAFAKVPLDGPNGLAARYFLGVTHVQEARKGFEAARQAHRANPQALEAAEADFHAVLARAEDAFLDVVATPAPDRRRQAIQEQAWLGLGRVYYEMGRPNEAIDAYQRIHRHSPQYYQSLYEVSWAFVRRGDYENARRAAEILLTGAEESILAPDVRLLLGHLHARAQRYERAIDTYDEVIVEYSPVRDDIDALLSLHDDPIRYFEELIGGEAGRFDVEALLPPAAVKWASTQQDVERGLAIVDTLEDGKTGIAEGRQIAERILASLDAGTLEPFPALAEGHQRTTETHTGLLRLQSRLAAVEHALLEGRIPPSLAEAYDRARSARARAEARFRTLPATPEELEARRERWLATVDRVHRDAFRARMASQSLNAQIVAMRVLLRDRRDEIVAEVDELEAFLRELEAEKAAVDRLEAEANALMRALDRLGDAVRADTAVAGARQVAEAYQRALADEQAVSGRVRAAIGATDAELARVDRVRGAVRGDVASLGDLLDDIERQARMRRQALRDQVLTEVRRLDAYEAEVALVGPDTQNLVGRIALDSVRAVRRQFYDLVLRADVGIIDVAWAQKSDRSREIQQLVEEQERQLRILDREFQEVLQDQEPEERR